MDPKVLIVSPQVFPQPHSGVGMRGHFQAVHMSMRWPVTLATEAGISTVIDGIFKQESSTEIPMASRYAAYCASLVTRRHYLYEKYGCRRWQLPPLGQFTHVIIHYPALLGLVGNSDIGATKVILDTHNNEREYYQTVAAESTNPAKRYVIGRQSHTSEAIIQRSKHVISATISVSESDRDWIAKLSDDRTEHFVVPNNLFEYSPTVWSGRKTILYVGSLDVTMNLQALHWFATNVWDRIRKVAPNMHFVVAGRNPDTSLVVDLERKGVKVVADAPSLKPLYEDAVCAVIPALSGSGGKIKVCESLAYGVPVITTSHGLVGQPASISECCTVTDEPSGWVHAIAEKADARSRSTPEWDTKVEAALRSTYFGSSIKQVMDYIHKC